MSRQKGQATVIIVAPLQNRSWKQWGPDPRNTFLRFYTTWFLVHWVLLKGVSTLVADGVRRKADPVFHHLLMSGGQADWEGN